MTLRIFLVFLCSFFLLYILADYSFNATTFSRIENLSLLNIVVYYIAIISKRLNLIIPFALLISCITVLTSLNQKNELLSFQVSGFSTHRLTRPFFVFGLLCVVISYINIELFSPKALSFIDNFEKKYIQKQHSSISKNINQIELKDKSLIIFEAQNLKDNKIYNAFWIHSVDKIFYIKKLTINKQGSIGCFIDLIERKKDNRLEKTASFEKILIKDLNTKSISCLNDNSVFANLPIYQLLRKYREIDYFPINQRYAIKAHLYYKIVVPWLSIIVLLSVIPSCILSRRIIRNSLIFALAIFGYIVLFSLINSMLILSENQTISPALAIFTVPSFILVVFGARFTKICFRPS